MTPHQPRLEIIGPDGDVRFCDLNQAQGLTRVGNMATHDILLEDHAGAPFELIVDHRELPYQVVLVAHDQDAALAGARLVADSPTPMNLWDELDIDGHTLLLVEGDAGPEQARPQPTALGLLENPTMPLPPDTQDGWIVAETGQREWETETDQPVRLTVSLLNRWHRTAECTVHVEGIPADWVNVTPSIVNLNQGAEAIFEITITARREPASRAGSYLVRLDASSKALDQMHRSCLYARLAVLPYYGLSVGSLDPALLTIGGRERSAEASLVIHNTGNCSARYRLQAEDDASMCRFEFRTQDRDATLTRHAHIAIRPRGDVQVIDGVRLVRTDDSLSDGAAALRITAIPRQRPFIALRSRLHHLVVTVFDEVSLAIPQPESARLLLKPVIGPWMILCLSLLIMAAIVLGAYPYVHTFTVDDPFVRLGSSVLLSWHVSPFVTELEIDGVEDPTLAVPWGQVSLIPMESQVYVLRAGNLVSDLLPLPPREHPLHVVVMPMPPTINTFDHDPERVSPGGDVTLRWSVSNADTIILRAGDFREELGPDEANGERTYPIAESTLLSIEISNQAGLDVQSAMVWVDQPVFDVQPAAITAGEPVTLSWRVAGADRVQLEPLGLALPPEFTLTDYPVDATDYVLAAEIDKHTLVTVSHVAVAPAPTPTPMPTMAASASAPAFPIIDVPFGVGIQVEMVGETDHERILGLVDEMGLTWIKQQVEWHLYNPSRGVYAWDTLDAVVQRANAQGLDILLSVTKAPEWAQPPGEPHGGPPQDPHDYARFLSELAHRYRGQVDAYEIWNEPNLVETWGGPSHGPNATEYVELLSAAYAAIKAADPHAVVVSGALATHDGDDASLAINDRRFLEQMYAAGLAEHCDAVGAHPLGYNNPPDKDWRTWQDSSAPGFKNNPTFFYDATMQDYYQIMVQNGDAQKRIWPTEFGWPATEGLNVPAAAGYAYAADNSEDEQAQYIVRAFQMGSTTPWVGPMFLWNLNFGPAAGKHDEKAAFGIVRHDWSRRPAVQAISDWTP